MPINDRTPAEHRPQVIGCQHVPEFLPMHQIAADGMTPVHVAPIPTKRVMLIKQMIFAFEINEPVGIVIPAASRREMKLWAQGLTIKVFGAANGVRQSD